MYKIGVVCQQLNISADCLRYYEKIHLLPFIHRDTSAQRRYTDADISRLKFIKRAQRIGFSLKEISQLLTFRAAPHLAKPEIRQLASDKLHEIESSLDELLVLKNELQLLVNLCSERAEDCPIINGLEQHD